MAHKTSYKVKLKRRRKGITNYKSRLALIKSKQLRLVARVSNNKITAQIIEYSEKGDKTLINTTSLELKKHGWKGHNGNLGAAYLTGLLCGTKAKKKNITKAIFDIGIHTPIHGSAVFSVLKGAIDAGIQIPHSEKAMPKTENINSRGNIEEVKNNIIKE